MFVEGGVVGSEQKGCDYRDQQKLMRHVLSAVMLDVATHHKHDKLADQANEVWLNKKYNNFLPRASGICPGPGVLCN